MEPQLQRVLILVVVIGSIIMAIGTVTLVIIFRRYGDAKAGGASHKKLIAALIAFIFLCCLGLFALSYFGG
jgi:hypothetical protein